MINIAEFLSFGMLLAGVISFVFLAATPLARERIPLLVRRWCLLSATGLIVVGVVSVMEDEGLVTRTGWYWLVLVAGQLCFWGAGIMASRLDRKLRSTPAARQV